MDYMTNDVYWIVKMRDYLINIINHKSFKTSLENLKSNDLIKKINPKSKLVFEFANLPNPQSISQLKEKYSITINQNQLVGELEDKKIKSLLIDLLKIDSSQKFTIDELPVEEAMKSFFINPDSFLK